MSDYIVNDGTDRDAWLAARDDGVGASEVPILFGEGYGDSAQLDLYARKLGLVEAITEDEGMSVSKELEPTIVRLVCERAGVEYARNVALRANALFPRLLCTADAITSAGEPVEVKNICHRVDDSEWQDGNIPLKYQLQLQSQMAVLEAERGLFGALLFGGRIVWQWLPRDNELIREIGTRVREFWSHVSTRTPCPPNGTRSSRLAAIAVAATQPERTVISLDVENLILDLNDARADESNAKTELAHLEKNRKSLEDKILLAMGAAPTATTPSGWKCIHTVTRRKGGVTKPSESHGLKLIEPGEAE